MSDHTGQYEFVVLEDGKRLDGRVIDDPFIVTHLEFHQSRWDAFKAIFKPLVKRYTFRVWGTAAATRVVMTSEYIEPEPVEKSGAVGYYATGVNGL